MSYNINSNTIVTPTGTIAPYIGTTDPSGWAICDGASRSNATGQYNNLINAGLINQNSYGTNSNIPFVFTIQNSGNSRIMCSFDGKVVVTAIADSGGAGGYPYISRDFGITYARLNASNFIGQGFNTGTYCRGLLVSANGNNIVISQDYTHVSTNGGNTFNSISVRNGIIAGSTDLKYITLFDLDAPSTLYLSSNYGNSFYQCVAFNRSSNGGGNGNTGTPAAISDNGLIIFHGWYNAGDFGIINYSLDGGTSWLTAPAFNGTTGKNQFFQGAISPNGQLWSFNSWLSTDTGNTWKYYATSGSAPNMYVLNDNRTIVYTISNTIYKTTDYGTTTTQTIVSGSSFIAFVQSVANYTTFYITGGLKSTDGGNTFTTPGTASTAYLPATYNFNQMATSQNGQLILAGNNSGYLYLSTNRGYSWAIQNNSLSANWQTVALSATTGQYQLAGSNSFLYLSTNAGSNWLPISGSQYGSTYGLLTTTGNWSSSAISNAGQYMLAGMNTGNLYMSTNSGNSWRLLGGAANTNGMPTTAVIWSSCAMNASGSLVAAAVSTGAIYLSTNSGTNWKTASSLSTSSPWSEVSIASSANYVIAAANSGNIFLSTDGAGATWTQPANLPVSAQPWQSLAISGDGSKLIAGTSASIIYASTTSGNSWTTLGGSSNVLGLPNAATSNWSSMAISQDGNTWLADVNGAQMYISADGKGALWGIKAAYNILGTGTWNALTISQDGTTVLAGNAASNLFVSYDSGNTYNALSSNGNLSGTKNWTGSAISSNNQIMTACATGDYPYLSSNSGLTWSNQLSISTASYTLPSASTIGKSWSAVQETTYIGIGQNWALLPTSTGLVTSASFYNASMSSTGQFMIAGIYGGATYLSSNYGGNWTATPTGLAASANYTGSSISATGQFMLVSTSTGTNYLSTSYGFSFSTTSTSTLGATESAMSVDGKYMLSANWISVNYGANWAAIAAGTGITTTNVNFWQPAISATGQYMILTSKQSAAGSPVNLSTSYGSFWTQNAISGMSTSAAATGCSISASGQFMVVLVLGGSTYLSSTYGQNWVQTPGTGLAASANYYSATMSSSGQYILIGGNAGTVNSAALSYFSSNYGANWLSAVGTPTQSYGISVAMSSNGQYMLNVGYGNGGVFVSSAVQSSGIPITNFATNFVSNPGGLPSTFAYPGTGMSASGQYLIVSDAVNGNGTWLSSNYGVSFKQLPKTGATLGFANGTGANPHNYNTNNISGNGQYMILAGEGGVYLSSNYGNYWSLVSAIGYFFYVALSYTGQYLIIGNYSSAPYISSNYGNNWNIVSSLPSIIFQVASMSSTGQYMMLSQNNTNPNSIYTSSSFGAYWVIAQSLPNSAQTYFGTVNYTGQYMGVGDTWGGAIYISSTYGANFAKINGYTRVWDFAISMTGQYMVFGSDDSGSNGLWASSAYGISSSWYKTPYNTSSTGAQTVKMSLDGTRLFVGPRSASGGYALCSSGFVPTNALSTFGPAVSFQQEITGYTLPTFLQSYYQIFPTNYGLTINNGANQMSSLKLSQTGQYIVVRGYQKTYISSTTGNNFFERSFQTFTNHGSLGMSYDGKYIVIGEGTYVYVSSSFGVNFTQITLPGASSSAGTNVTVSGNGKYMLATSDTKIFLSNNYGVSFSLLTSSTGISTSASWTPPAISNDGQYMFVSHITSGQGHYISSNYGSNWIVTSIPNTFISNGPSAMSSSGKYMVAYPFGAYIYFSSTFGKSFYSPTLPSVLPSTYLAFTGAYMDQTGQYTILSNHGGSIVYSTNYGATFLNMSNPAYSIVSNGNPQCNMSGDGLITFITGNQGSSTSWYVSTTYASSYTGTATSALTSPTVSTPVYKTSYGTTWVTNPGTGLPGDVFFNGNCNMSGTGQYMFVSDEGGTYNGAYISSNFGNTWTKLGTANGFSSTTITRALYCTAMSSNGQYIVFTGTDNNIYVSSNSGAYFINSYPLNAAGISISGNGQYILGQNYLSSDYGKTFTGVLAIGNVWGSGISFDGQYMCTFPTSTGGNIYVSTSFGKFWTSKFTSTTSNSNASVSYDGQYMYVNQSGQSDYLSSDFGKTFRQLSIATYFSSISRTGQFIVTGTYLSTNYGINFNLVPIPTGPRNVAVSYYGEYILASHSSMYLSSSVSSTISTAAVVSNPYWLSVATDATGQYVVVGSIMNQGIWYSSDFANTWQTSNQNVGTVQQLANSGTYMLAAINNISGIYYSSNYGAWWQQSATPNSANYICVSMSSSSTFAVAGSIGGGVVYSSTYGQTWQSSNFTTGTFGAVAMSSTGQYGLASNSTTIYYSINFGQTFIASSLTTVNAQSLAISQTGQCAVAGTTTGIYYSNNYGQTWSQATGSASTGTWYGINIMSSGQYVVAGNAGQGLWYSLNFGETWTQSTSNTTDTWYEISTTPSGSYLYAVSQSTTVYQETNVTAIMTLSVNGLPTAGSSWQTAAMDSTGQYQLLGVNGGFLYFSNNFGNAWSTISGQSPITQLYNSGNGLPTIALAWSTSSMNSTGQYALAGINGGALYMTTNTATSWTPISGLGPLGATGPWLASNYGMTTNSLAWQTTSMNSTGQYMLAGSNNNFLYLSTNSGTYWAIIGGSAYGSTFGQGLPTVGGAWYTSAISSTGQYMATGLYGGAFYFSKNYGQAWTAYTSSPLSSAVNWYSMSMTSSGTSIVASSNGANIYNMTTMVIPTTTYTPPQISGTSSTDGTGLKYIIKL
jgi:hypothetical protein